MKINQSDLKTYGVPAAIFVAGAAFAATITNALAHAKFYKVLCEIQAETIEKMIRPRLQISPFQPIRFGTRGSVTDLRCKCADGNKSAAEDTENVKESKNDE